VLSTATSASYFLYNKKEAIKEALLDVEEGAYI